MCLMAVRFGASSEYLLRKIVVLCIIILLIPIVLRAYLPLSCPLSLGPCVTSVELTALMSE